MSEYVLVPLVPNGSPTGPPDPKSASLESSDGAFDGLKKSFADSVPSEPTDSRMTDSASWAGGLLPGPFGGEMPLPEATMIRPDPSDMTPPPLCQMPPFLLAPPTSSAQSVVVPGLPTLKPAT